MDPKKKKLIKNIIFWTVFAIIVGTLIFLPIYFINNGSMEVDALTVVIIIEAIVFVAAIIWVIYFIVSNNNRWTKDADKYYQDKIRIEKMLAEQQGYWDKRIKVSPEELATYALQNYMNVLWAESIDWDKTYLFNNEEIDWNKFLDEIRLKNAPQAKPGDFKISNEIESLIYSNDSINSSLWKLRLEKEKHSYDTSGIKNEIESVTRKITDNLSDRLNEMVNDILKPTVMRIMMDENKKYSSSVTSIAEEGLKNAQTSLMTKTKFIDDYIHLKDAYTNSAGQLSTSSDQKLIPLDHSSPLFAITKDNLSEIHANIPAVIKNHLSELFTGNSLSISNMKYDLFAKLIDLYKKLEANDFNEAKNVSDLLALLINEKLLIQEPDLISWIISNPRPFLIYCKEKIVKDENTEYYLVLLARAIEKEKEQKILYFLSKKDWTVTDVNKSEIINYINSELETSYHGFVINNLEKFVEFFKMKFEAKETVSKLESNDRSILISLFFNLRNATSYNDIVKSIMEVKFENESLNSLIIKYPRFVINVMGQESINSFVAKINPQLASYEELAHFATLINKVCTSELTKQEQAELEVYIKKLQLPFTLEQIISDPSKFVLFKDNLNIVIKETITKIGTSNLKSNASSEQFRQIATKATERQKEQLKKPLPYIPVDPEKLTKKKEIEMLHASLIDSDFSDQSRSIKDNRGFVAFTMSKYDVESLLEDAYETNKYVMEDALKLWKKHFDPSN